MSLARRSAAFACTFIVFAPVIIVGASREASAALACDAGTICPDKDNDGFAACGCPWSGTPCDCNDDDPSRFPGAPERCDSARDFNCGGPDGGLDGCPVGTGCLAGTCVQRCVPLDDFGCPANSRFSTAEAGPPVCLCEPRDCSVFGCPAGEVCDDTKICVPICSADVRCPPGQICRGFGCVDPCAEVTCPQDSVCDRGRCLPSCTCDPTGCPAGKACDLTALAPACVDEACVGVRCAAGTHCNRGTCQDDCEGVVCPIKRVCRVRPDDAGAPRAECGDLCSPDPCKLGDVCEWRTGTCTRPPGLEGGLLAPNDPSEYLEVAGAGWQCGSAELRVSLLSLFAMGVTTLGLLLRRRRSPR